MTVSNANSTLFSSALNGSIQTKKNLPGNNGSAATFADLLADVGNTSASDSTDSTTQAFEKSFKETPIQRFTDAWLKKHGITPEQFANMDPAKKEKIVEEIKKDFQTEMKQQADRKSDQKSLDVAV